LVSIAHSKFITSPNRLGLSDSMFLKPPCLAEILAACCHALSVLVSDYGSLAVANVALKVWYPGWNRTYIYGVQTDCTSFVHEW